MSENEFDHERFAANIGAEMILTAGDGRTAALELVEVRALRDLPHQRSYSVTFLGPQEAVFEQGTFQLDNEKLGRLEIFLVPVGVTDGRMRLESIFNLIRSDEDASAKGD